MKFVILNVPNKDAGARDHISVCLVGTSNTIINVCQTVFTCLGIFNILNYKV